MDTPATGRIPGIAIRGLVLCALFLAAWRTVLVSAADWNFRQGSRAAIEHAEALLPSNARYHYAHALAVEQDEPRSPAIPREFAAAAQLNPRYPDALLALSVEKEIQGDKAGAEALLLQARSIDHMMRPTWALANYYLRQGNAEKFWPEAQQCLRLIGATGLDRDRFSPFPIYQLCWRMSDDPNVILARAIPKDDRIILSDYLGYLVSVGKLDAAIPVAELNLPGAQPWQMEYYWNYLDQLLSRNLTAPAIRLWHGLFLEHLLPYPGPDLEKNVFLTNGDLAGDPMGKGFDWRLQFADPIRFNHGADHSYNFDFDRNQAETAPLMMQIVPVLPGRGYRLTARSHSDFDPQEAGLRWVVNDRRNGHPIALQASESADDPRTVTVDFAVSPQTDAVDLVLRYEREPGTTQIHGSYQLLGAEIKLR